MITKNETNILVKDVSKGKYFWEIPTAPPPVSPSLSQIN